MRSDARSDSVLSARTIFFIQGFRDGGGRLVDGFSQVIRLASLIKSPRTRNMSFHPSRFIEIHKPNPPFAVSHPLGINGWLRDSLAHFPLDSSADAPLHHSEVTSFFSLRREEGRPPRFGRPRRPGILFKFVLKRESFSRKKIACFAAA